MKTFEVTRTVSQEDIINLLYSGFEGGSGYWCRIEDFRKPSNDDMIPEEHAGYKHVSYCWGDGAVICSEFLEDDSKPLELTEEKILSGLKVMAEKFPSHFSNIFENQDGTTGDVFLQCCLLGDIIYG